MIGRLRGYFIWGDGVHEVLIETDGGVSYEVFMPLTDASWVADREGEMTIFTRQIIRDDGQKLYGFIEITGKMIFDGLIGIKGVGPSIALKVLSHWAKPRQFLEVLFDDSSNQQVMEGIPGIGKTTATKLIAEGKIAFASYAPAESND